MSLTIIVAHSRNRVIGRAGELPWRLPGDLRRFKELTTGHTVIMGRKTYESLPDKFRPLPDRTNVVISRNPNLALDGCLVADSIERAVALTDSDPVFVIGGGQIYRLALPLADQVLVTQIDAHIEGDSHFPPLGEEWTVTRSTGPTLEDNLEYWHLTYTRRRS
jgi:dihydrofolate reductase